jgi:hypothetical protein
MRGSGEMQARASAICCAIDPLQFTDDEGRARCTVVSTERLTVSLEDTPTSRFEGWSEPPRHGAFVVTSSHRPDSMLIAGAHLVRSAIAASEHTLSSGPAFQRTGRSSYPTVDTGSVFGVSGPDPAISGSAGPFRCIRGGLD